MAKPDLQGLRVTPAGEAYRDDGKLGLALAFNALVVVTGTTDTASFAAEAVASGVPVGGLYVNEQTGAITRRLV